ncbi:endoribonuclease dcr-1 [Condylostylus longicornis]|uniref:endoribonuclease dcr-1 n=1 Tax=Condylostylus longicornis TaxID=2530218 RepID=UPI00244E1776|nr:endoribonuclease dcr-1 [Condylostylus longicornis]XP_055377212.1 endoribonuclease dcr-1 [Condylostylus longicornis]
MMEMKEQEELDIVDEKISFKSRIYQDQLLQHALKENVIIYLPTGSGKTFIALMALKEMSKDLEGTLENGGKRSIFMANTVALARQQFLVVKNFTSLKVRLYTGDMNVDNWKREKWEIELDSTQVIVATTQIILNIVRHKYLSINQINLMIFDECHHATKGHPMLQLMGQFADACQKSLPRVIGLTGILIKSTTDNIIEELKNLEAVFRAKIATVSSFNHLQNVLLYSTKPKEVLISFDDIDSKHRITNSIQQLVSECISKFQDFKIDETHFVLTKNMETTRYINPIKKMKNLLEDYVYQLNDLGLYGGYIAMLSVLVEVELKKRRAETIASRNMYRIIISYVERILHLLRNTIFDADDETETELDVIYDTSSRKVVSLLTYLKKEFVGKTTSDIKCLVFVQRRHTAKNLHHIIKNFVKYNDNIPVIANFMVGVHELLPESIECILERKTNREILNNFNKNECNLIVASSVLEEGIDIQSCNYVIVYDELKSFASYLQTKGRARMQDSTYIMMVGNSKKNGLILKVKKYQEIDLKLKNYLINKTIDRSLPLQEEIDKQFETLIEPFYSKIGAKLDADVAIPLCSRYCDSLPNDAYTIASPKYSKINTGNEKKRVKLLLPLQSTIKEDIISDEMPTIKWAKRSAAFKACIMLYQKGELNDHLLPVSRKQCLDYHQSIYFKEWQKYPDDDKYLAGHRKNRRIHNLNFPKQLCSNEPVLGSVCYFYTINILPEFERSDENYHVFDSLSNKANFAILLVNKLPKIAPMPLFMSQGRVTVQISSRPYETVIYNREQYIKLKNFNTMLFRKLIKDTWSSNYAQDFRNAENSYIIVPTINGEKIDWELVESIQNINDVSKIDIIQRKKMNIRAEDYLHNLVATWYTSDDSVRFIVTKIRRDLTPLSPFPDGAHESFVTYLQDKWGQKVIQTNSFMLEVEPFTSRINFLTYNEEKKKSKRFNSILLVPELVHNFNFPGHFYLKARFLPSILFRLHYILIAEEIRISLNSFLNIDSKNYDPRPLIVDKTLLRVKKCEKPKEFSNFFDEKFEDKKVKRIEQNRNQIYNWREHEEPCDLARNIQNLYKVDVDYFHYFISLQKFAELTITDDNEQFSVINNLKLNKKDLPTTSKNAICDVNMSEKTFISILNVDDNCLKSPEQWEILCAITAAGANDVFDGEKLEVLGDSFLKFSISLWLLHKHPSWNEGFLTEVKGQFTSNRNLLYHAIKMNLPGALYTKAFKPNSEWKPPSINIPKNAEELVCRDDISPSVFTELELNMEEIFTGKCSEQTLIDFQSKFSNYENYPNNESDMSFLLNKTWISDKICSDAVEAILGVCIKIYGVKKSFLMLEYFGIIPTTPDLINLLNIDLGNPRLRTDITDREVDSFLLNFQQLEANLGYKFRDRAYLLQALTHPSYPTNRLTGCYQQLEFIGDAILDFLITCYIFERCGDMDPGKLTDLRSALVNNVTLACLTVRHKFHLFLLSQNAALTQSIITFTEFQAQNNFKVTDQVRILMLENEVNSKMADYINVPKTLGDIFEALIGAVFLDSGNDLNTTWNVIFNLMSVEIYEFIANVPIQIVRQLYEYHGSDPIFDSPIVDDDVIMVKCSFTCRNERIEVHGFGKNKKEAKVSAAKSALKHLQNS